MIILDSVRTAVKAIPMSKTVSKTLQPIRENIKDAVASSVSEGTLQNVGPYVLVLGSTYVIIKTCIKVYNATSPANAILVGVKGVLIDCTPPVIKYPALCAAIAGCTAGAGITGDPNFIVGALECTSTIIKK